ncbi:MAG: HU family DNA-binding protein [Spirochaetia bacterium]|nr:HU family DNA-binding protein [Spirochaetia bacterium]
MEIENLPKAVQAHLLNLIKSSPLPDTPEFHSRLAGIWDKKCRLFEQQTSYLDMELTEKVAVDDSRAMIILTYSGSIVSIGPLKESRAVEYASIHLRGDVPKSVLVTATTLDGDVAKDKPVCFTAGQIKKTSAAYMIAVCNIDLAPAVQAERIREAMIYLTNGFLKINQSIHIDRKSVPDHFTSKSMARYIAKRHDLTGALVQDILDDFLYLVETGMLLGESVPLGKIGRLSLKKKEAQKARIVRHPETGEEITVKSKPAVAIPRISFSQHIKDKAAELPVEGDSIIETE